MTEVVRIHEVGGADRFVLETVETPAPAAGEVLVGQRFAGVNYVDVYHRSGLYPLPKMPAILGVEGAGVIKALGPDVEGLSIGALAEAMAMSKSGVFAHFGSREELQISVIREYETRFAQEVFFPALREARGLPRLRGLFERWVHRVSAEAAAGCIHTSGAVEGASAREYSSIH